jgi:MFS family permease
LRDAQPLGYARPLFRFAEARFPAMIGSIGLLKERRFLPLFVTQFFGAFNDNLFKQAMVLFATYRVFNDARVESMFNGIAMGLSLIPFFLLSALSGQLADTIDKARIIRWVKTAEIGIMLLGGAGLLISLDGHTRIGIGLMLAAVLLLGVHSTFFGPIKYAILPQHLDPNHVLGGTGLIEAGTYLSILLGTILAGALSYPQAIAATLVVAGIGWVAGRMVPPAPRIGPRLEISHNPVTSSWRLISATMHIPRLFLAICSISFFWTIGAVLITLFPPLVKNLLTADRQVASLVLAIFSVGIAGGSLIVNRLLRGRISAKFAPISVIAMGGFIVLFSLMARMWIPAPPDQLYGIGAFLREPRAVPIIVALLGIAITGGMFVVPLYAFLTTTVSKDQTARTVAANNVVNSGAMVVGVLMVTGLAALGTTPENMLFLAAAMCLVAAWLAQKLHLACD